VIEELFLIARIMFDDCGRVLSELDWSCVNEVLRFMYVSIVYHSIWLRHP
jgi:hypothetical protein